MDQERRELSTADLARTGDDLRGRSDEDIRSRAAREDREAATRPIQASVQSPAPESSRSTGSRPTADMAEAPRASRPQTPMLFPEDQTEFLRTRWAELQGTFVDAPRESVAGADALVADVMRRMAEGFANERANLERQWDKGDDVTTEDLRVALQRYRAFFDRLLSV